MDGEKAEREVLAQALARGDLTIDEARGVCAKLGWMNDPKRRRLVVDRATRIRTRTEIAKAVLDEAAVVTMRMTERGFRAMLETTDWAAAGFLSSEVGTILSLSLSDLADAEHQVVASPPVTDPSAPEFYRDAAIRTRVQARVAFDGITAGTIRRPVRTHRRSRPLRKVVARRACRSQSRRAAAASGRSPDDPPGEPPRPLAAAAGRGDDSGDTPLQVALQSCYSAGLSGRECFEAAAILERRGEWLIGRAA